MSSTLLTGQELPVDGMVFVIAEHPAAPGMPYGQEGRQATVYQVVSASGERRALKVFKPRFRVPALVTLSQRLVPFATLPGLAVCRRTVLSARRSPDLLRQYPDLTYAVLMPWIHGPTWMEVLVGSRPFTPVQSVNLAHALAEVLAAMEERGLAHTDLSGPNVLLPSLDSVQEQGLWAVELVDVEQMYGPGLERPEALPGGSSGYAHRSVSGGVWEATADRFAGGVLLSEMLAWCDDEVRRAAWGESYFDPNEMQRLESTRYRVLVDRVKKQWGDGPAKLLEQVWASETLGDCPTFGEWLVTLPDLPQAISNAVSPSAVGPATLAPRTSPAPASVRAASLQQLLDEGQQRVEQGDLEGGVNAYRRALSYTVVGSGLAAELELIIADLEARKTAAGSGTPTVATGHRAGVPASPSARREVPLGHEHSRIATAASAPIRATMRHRLAWLVGIMALLIVVAGIWLTFQMQNTARSSLTDSAAMVAAVTSEAGNPDTSASDESGEQLSATASEQDAVASSGQADLPALPPTATPAVTPAPSLTEQPAQKAQVALNATATAASAATSSEATREAQARAVAVAVPSTWTPNPPTWTPVPPTWTPLPPTWTSVPPTWTPVPPTWTPNPPTWTPALPTWTPIPPPTWTPRPPTSTPLPPDPTVDFRADQTQLNAGQCTTLRWDVEYVRAVYLDGEGVAGHSTKQVCPSQSRTYTLRVVTDAGAQDYPLSINVNVPAPTPWPPTPAAAPTLVTDSELAAAISQARADLARRIGSTAQSARVLQAERREWPSPALGCPVSGIIVWVVTPGYLIVLQANNRVYRYHGDTNGRWLVCDD